MLKRNSDLAFYHRFEENVQSNNFSAIPNLSQASVIKCQNQKYHFEEPKWFLIKIIFLVAFLNKDKKDLIDGVQ